MANNLYTSTSLVRYIKTNKNEYFIYVNNSNSPHIRVESSKGDLPVGLQLKLDKIYLLISTPSDIPSVTREVISVIREWIKLTEEFTVFDTTPYN